MQIRDVLMGAVTWIIAVSLFVGTIAATQHFYGQPISDRRRVLAFAMRCAGLVFAIVIIAAIVIPIVVSER